MKLTKARLQKARKKISKVPPGVCDWSKKCRKQMSVAQGIECSLCLPLLFLFCAAMRHGEAFECLPVMFSSSQVLDVLCIQTKSTEFGQLKVNLDILPSDLLPVLVTLSEVVSQWKSAITIFPFHIYYFVSGIITYWVIIPVTTSWCHTIN